MYKPRLRSLAVAALVLSTLAGCATHRNQPNYQSNYPQNYPQGRVPQQPPGQAQYGVVQSVDLVRAENQTSGAGAVLGGVIGAVVGRQFGSRGGRDAATAVGAVGGAVIGNQVEKNKRSARDFYRVLVRFEDGGQRNFDYEQPVDLRPGDRVWLQNNQLTRG